jgi:hypothetical protein
MRTLISIQDEAITKICALRKYPNSLSVCGRLSRSVRPIHRRFEKELIELGFTKVLIYQQWRDVCDMVKLNDNAETE